MSEQMDKQISELLDGELEETQLSGFLERYARDRELRRRFSRYVIGRDCLQRISPRRDGGGFADRVMEALADEPVVLAPKRRSAFSGERARRILRPAAGIAVAASVATVAVLGLRGDYTEERPDAPQVQASRQVTPETPVPGSRSPDFQYADVQVRRPMTQTVSAGDRAWLNDYLLRHKEASGFVGRSGFTPYVHIVAREAPTESARPPAQPEPANDPEEPLRRLPVDTQPE